jgi:predicted lipoprotein with Yx(FWY)xxD motif
MRSNHRGRRYIVAVVLTLAVACRKNGSQVNDTAAGALEPEVAVTTEVAPGILMTVEAPPGSEVVLADGNGRSLYVLDGVPTDTTTWKPVSGSARMTSTDPKVSNSMIGTTTNANGQSQATYNGKPLYYYSGDTAAGERKGNGVRASGTTGHSATPQGNAARGTTR